MTEVSKLARSYLGHKRGREHPERTVTFSIRLTEGQHAKLKLLSQRFDVAKSPLAQELLNSAMNDALRILGASDAISEKQEGSLSWDEQNRMIDEQLEEYNSEIRRIIDEESIS